MTMTDALPATNADGFELIARHLSPHKARAYEQAGMLLVQGRRDGVRVWDLDGRDYINCRSSGGVFNFGHSPRFAVEALASAVREHDMGDWLLPSARRARGAAALARLLPAPLRYFRSDRRLWLLMQRLRRADRTWQRQVRRRPYPFLLAPPYRYGPMTPPGGEPS